VDQRAPAGSIARGRAAACFKRTKLLRLLFWRRSGGRRPNGGPRIIRCLVRNLVGRRAVGVVDLLSPFLLFRRQRLFLLSAKRHFFGINGLLCAKALPVNTANVAANGMSVPHVRVSLFPAARIDCISPASPPHPLERNRSQTQSIAALIMCRGMIFSENRFPLFRIMP
jgi:hypothetical protein